MMTATATTFDAIARVIADAIDVDLDDVHPDLEMYAIPEWTSLAHVELMGALEDCFGITISGDQVRDLTSVAAIRRLLGDRDGDTPAPSGLGDQRIHRGLDGVVFDTTAMTRIDGENGELRYAGYSIGDLAANASFDQVAYLLLFGELPSAWQLAEFQQILVDRRPLPAATVRVLEACADLHPVDAMRTAISTLGSGRPTSERSPNELLDEGLTILAQMPAILATIITSGAPLAAQTGSFVTDFLIAANMPTDPETVALLTTTLIVQADHSANASAFCGRIAASTGTDLAGSLTAAIAAFAGPLHGGAVEQMHCALSEISHAEAAESYVAKKRANGEPVMGFGHRVYRTTDPRSGPLYEAALRTSAAEAGGSLEILDALRNAMTPYQRHGVNVNVDFYAGVIYTELGLVPPIFPCMFVLARAVGWIAHAVEQAKRNVLIRPRLAYDGPADRKLPLT